MLLLTDIMGAFRSVSLLIIKVSVFVLKNNQLQSYFYYHM